MYIDRQKTMKNQAPAAILNSTTPAQTVYRVQAPRLTRTPQSPYADQPVIAADEQAMERDYSSSTLTDICSDIHLKFEPDRVWLDLALFNEHYVYYLNDLFITANSEAVAKNTTPSAMEAEWSLFAFISMTHIFLRFCQPSVSGDQIGHWQHTTMRASYEHHELLSSALEKVDQRGFSERREVEQCRQFFEVVSGLQAGIEESDVKALEKLVTLGLPTNSQVLDVDRVVPAAFAMESSVGADSTITVDIGLTVNHDEPPLRSISAPVLIPTVNHDKPSPISAPVINPTPSVTSWFSESLEYDLYIQQHWMNLRALAILAKPPTTTMKYPISDEWSDRLWALRQIDHDQRHSDPSSESFGLRRLFGLRSSRASGNMGKLSPNHVSMQCRRVIVFVYHSS